ncbi:hypothetical protein BDN72DRAFT_958199 [Pluteus cervinus]|uniref:Uncharacterized protein n=1 Tax=Pluteus cervinus TaxID=181527 RepID=A0ACD3B0B1_9AGAR|nr:hypothetical protein BDN72DRAFT_958199 [Pluteus cervinus]
MAKRSPPQGPPSFSLAGLTPDTAYETIMTEILRSENHTYDQNVLHNSTTPVSRLPNELLSRVMELAYQMSRSPSRTRLYLSWVCRHWRYVAIGFPQLWCTIKRGPWIDSMCTAYIEECIARSEAIDLEVDLEVDLRSPPDGLLKLCMSQFHRIRSLVHAPARSLTLASVLSLRSRPAELWNRPAPSLSSLALTGTFLPLNPFDGVYPGLKSLKLKQCGFDRSFPLSISTLTTLHIVFPVDAIPVDFLVRRLSMMPSLIAVYLRACLANATAPITTQFVLPSLQSLRLGDKLDHIFAFLRAIKTPDISSLRATISVESLGEEEFSTTIDIFKTIHPSLWNDIRHLILRPVGGFSIEVEGSSSSMSESKGILKFYSNQRRRIPGGLSVCRHLFIDHLETLSVDEELRGLPGIEAFQSLQSIRQVRFGGIMRSHMVIASDLLTHIQERDGQTTVSLPSLTEVHCDGPSSELYDLLKQRRQILQRRLPKLTFCECSPANMKVFERVADLVACDGILSVKGQPADMERGWEV